MTSFDNIFLVTSFFFYLSDGAMCRARRPTTNDLVINSISLASWGEEIVPTIIRDISSILSIMVCY